jgi:multidrug transporter EmrE-like cation transporter
MTLNGWIYILICSVTVVSANILLREGVRSSGVVIFENGIKGLYKDVITVLLNPMLLACLFFYGISMLIWFRLVATQPISVAYPVLATLTFVGISLAGIIVFQESVSLLKITGLCLALTGCLLLAAPTAS